ncbi:MAG TPA: hypothetical protein VFG87_10880 [Amycolatopsis sp.]|nr:hypothetical protein [Amycolatopsis sp.]
MLLVALLTGGPITTDKFIARAGGPDGSTGAAGSGTVNGDVIDATSLRNVPPEISGVANGELIVYRMPGMTRNQITATAMLFVPKGPAPTGGFPLVVWGHGTVGWAPQCAPSVQLQEHNQWADGPNAAVLAAILKMRIAIVAPDYEGLGPVSAGVTEGHGYYDLSSSGNSMIFAAVAAQRYLGTTLSGQWAPAGWSEGGFAALAAADYSGLATKADPALVYRGTITLAPVPDVPAMNKILWQDIDNASGSGLPPTAHQISQLVFANAETIYFTKTENFAGYPVDPSQVYGANMLKFYRQDWQACIDELNTAVRQDIQGFLGAAPANRLNTYPGVRQDGPDALPEIKRFFAQNQAKLESSTLPGSILWLYGTDDITSPSSVTYNVVNEMVANGNDINLAVLEGAGHYDIPVTGLPLIQARLRRLFTPGR